MSSAKALDGKESERWGHPCWDDYREMITQLEGPAIPGPGQLNALLPRGTQSGGGAPLRFVPSQSIPGVQYERHIFATGEVSTRGGNWHDLFNALVWCRLPRLKAAMNALHHRDLHHHSDGARGPRRDALTLLDESGALVASRNRDLLHALARRDWDLAFVALRAAWRTDTRVVICGHALLEKFLEPYKSITAHALLLQVDAPPSRFAAEDFPGWLDAAVGERLLAGGCASPADLSPLPLAGIPGWWREAGQDAGFYADRSVFRPPPAGFRAAPAHRLELP
jgi:hypothetical protein